MGENVEKRHEQSQKKKEEVPEGRAQTEQWSHIEEKTLEAKGHLKQTSVVTLLLGTHQEQLPK